MEYKLFYHPDVKYDDLKNIPANIRERIRKAIENRILFNPVMAGEPLRQSLKYYRKLRVGDWRVIYRIEADKIVILIIGNRKDVYREVFKRMRPAL